MPTPPFGSRPGDVTAHSPEADLWFLPGPETELPESTGAHAWPLPQADRTRLFNLGEWEAAQATHAAELARVASRLGALDERLRTAPEGWCQRLAHLEVSDLVWFTGDRIGPDRLALWLAMRANSTRGDEQALARAAWALRRLSGGPGPEADLPEFLGRAATEEVGLLLQGSGELHPISRAAFIWHTWSMASDGRNQRLEAAVIASRIGAQDTSGTLLFLPLALGGAPALRSSGSVQDRMSAWYAGADVAVRAALAHLDRLDTWQDKTERAVAQRTGRTARESVRVLTEWPLVSAAMAEKRTGASRTAVQRNLTWLEAEGLIRETTGQNRFRFWEAAL